VIWLDVDDEMSEVTLAARLMITDLLRETRPDVVITHYDLDYHVDHRNASQLLFEAAPLACVHNIITEHPVLDKQVLIYYMDTLGAINFLPTEYVDITDTIETKKQMFHCHASQDEWMLKATGFDMTEVLDAVARVRGYAAGCKFAEGFRRLEAWYRGTTTRVLP
jgi:LmbE family N-acetylglucosaminyl deacetylase